MRRHEQVRLDSEVRRREAERAAARIAGDHDPLDLGRTSEQRRGAVDVVRSVTRRYTLDQAAEAYAAPTPPTT